MSTEGWKKDDRREIGEKKRKLSTDEKSTSSNATNKKFRSFNHAEKTLEIFESYFNDKLLTDVTLVTNSKCIKAHRIVLSASSPYFSTMFTSFFKESCQDEIEMKEINEDALVALVHYCYTGSIELHKDNVEILFATAHLLQMDPVVEACSQFLIKQLDSCNCLGIRTLADAHGCDSLSSAAHEYALEYFVQVVQNEEFLLLSADKVAELLESEDVNVPSEETIFNALTTWLKHDSINRIKDASKLLSYVRLPLLTSEFIADHVQGNELFNDQPIDSLLKSGCTRPRKSTVDILLVFGEKADDSEADAVMLLQEFSFPNRIQQQQHIDLPLSLPIDAFLLRKNIWKNITNMRNRGNTFGAVCFGKKLFVVRRNFNEIPTNTIESFDFSNQLWETWPSMNTRRDRVGVGILNGFLYTIGGFENSWKSSNTVERCDLASQEWSFAASMSTGRSEAGVAVLNNKLYVVGGWIGRKKLKTMECYDPKTNKWTFCSPMSTARSAVGIGVLNGYIYVIGGLNNKGYLNSAERYDAETDKWTMIAPMSVERYATGVGVLGNQLFVVGGFGDAGYLTLVEAYDPALNEWQEFAPLKRSRAGPCVVVDKTICKLQGVYPNTG